MSERRNEWFRGEVSEHYRVSGCNSRINPEHKSRDLQSKTLITQRCEASQAWGNGVGGVVLLRGPFLYRGLGRPMASCLAAVPSANQAGCSR